MKYFGMHAAIRFLILAIVVSAALQISAFLGSSGLHALTGGGVQSVLNFGDGHQDAVITSSWSRTFGGEGIEHAESVIQTSDGGYAIIGFTTPYGAINQDLLLVKTDSIGNEEWSKVFGGEGNEHGSSVIQTSDGGYALAGSTSSHGAINGDFWLVKTDPSGNAEWNNTFGGRGNDHAYSIIQTSEGGYALAGFTGSHGAGNQDFWLVKTDSSGNEEWSKTFGGMGFEWAYSVVQTSDEGYTLAGYTTSYGSGKHDFWVVKTSSINQNIPTSTEETITVNNVNCITFDFRIPT